MSYGVFLQEFLRFSELFMYALRLCFARSVAEIASVRSANLYEFMFGYNYGWMLLIFAMTCAYCVVCPLITPFGLLYFVLKHLVDRHNLAFVYARSKINKKVHALAINFVIMSVALLQFFMVIFSFIRSLDYSFSALDPRTKVPSWVEFGEKY